MDNNLNNLSEEEKKRKQRAIQMEVIILESDVRKFTREKGILEADMRRIRQNQERIRIEADEKRKKFDRIIQDIAAKEMEIKKLRKSLYLIK